MNESELRGWVAAHLNLDTVPKSVWDILTDQGLVAKALEQRALRDSLVKEARALLLVDEVIEQVESLSEQYRHGPEADPPQFGAQDEERTETRTECLAFIGTAYPGVLGFRNACWGESRPLTAENARRLVEEEELLEVLSGRDRSPDTDYLEPSGYLEFFGRTPGQTQYIEFHEGSDFERLQALSQELVEKLFPLWSEAEAAWFVLTGEVPVSKALLGEVYSYVGDHITYGTITLTIEPWIAAQTVLKAYQHLQAKMLQRKPRPLSRRNMAVVRFVMRELKELVIAKAEGQPEQADYPGEELIDRIGGWSLDAIYQDATIQDGWTERQRRSWRILMDRWNRENPDSTYQDERQFYRDFHRVAHAVVRPYGGDAAAARLSIP